MFRYDHNGRESYQYKPQDKAKDGENMQIYFLTDTRISMDEKYVLAQKKKQEILEQEEISSGEQSEAHWGEDTEWIIRLAKQIRKHWDVERSYHENCETERREERRKEHHE